MSDWESLYPPTFKNEDSKNELIPSLLEQMLTERKRAKQMQKEFQKTHTYHVAMLMGTPVKLKECGPDCVYAPK